MNEPASGPFQPQATVVPAVASCEVLGCAGPPDHRRIGSPLYVTTAPIYVDPHGRRQPTTTGTSVTAWTQPRHPIDPLLAVPLHASPLRPQ